MSSVSQERQPVPKWLTQLFPLRVLSEHDEKHGFFVAYCLETGSVTTAEDMETVLDMMKELLEDEVSRVIASRNVANLFSTSAPFEVWEKWTQLAEEGHEIGEIELDIKVPIGRAHGGNTSTTVAVLKAAA